MVGNDNYRPNMMPPSPVKSRGGWLSSNMAQLMVFLNGLILTVTAYATLSVFIHQIVKEDFLKTTNEVQEHLASSYQNIEETLTTLGVLIEVLPDNNVGSFSNYTQKKIANLDGFEEIFWIRKEGSENNITSILNNNKFSNEWPHYLMRHKDDFDKTKGLFVIERKYLPNLKTALYDDILVIGKTVENKPNDILIGVFDSKKIISKKWLENRNNISSLEVLNDQRDAALFSYFLDSKISKSNYVNMFNVTFAGDTYDVRVNLKTGRREAFLQKIPLLMLLFGVTLTLIGTLYVRNNQNQSQKLSAMNKELAYKNYELNQEISERERLNVLVQTSAKENKAIINAVSDIIFEVSIEGTLLFLNDSWGKVTGFSLDRSLGRNLFDLLYVEDQNQQKQDFSKLVKGQKQSYRSFTRLRCSNGKYRTIEIAFSMLRQDENGDLRAVGTITDVEERRRAEKALSEAEKKYRKIVENAASGIYQVTPEGQFLSANPAFAKTLGYDNVEDILRDVSQTKEQLYVDVPLREKILKDIAVLGMAKQADFQLRRRDGDIIWVSENIRPVLDDEGTLLFYEGSMEDIDQRKNAEIALKEAMIQSDLSSRAKSEFLTNMSHELRTPLNSVIGFAEIIKNEAYGALPSPEYKEYATNIHESGKGLLNVINDILDVSHIDAGNRDLKEGIVHVPEIVASCLEMTNAKITNKKIRVDNKVTNADLNLIGEKHAIKQMLLNLISNAVRFSPEESYIMVDAEIDHAGRMRISVTDTGVGLTEKELEKALSPFGQVNAEHKREKSGTGLGLTLVKSLVELHGGGLEMVSQKNIGTTATLTFPKKRVSNPQVKAADTTTENA